MLFASITSFGKKKKKIHTRITFCVKIHLFLSLTSSLILQESVSCCLLSTLYIPTMVFHTSTIAPLTDIFQTLKRPLHDNFDL